MGRFPLLTLLAAVWLSVLVAQAQVCEGDITLTTQAEVDAFACTEVTGELSIVGDSASNITHLDGLAGLTSVGGSLQIQNNAALPSLDGLGGITSVGSLSISFNPVLTDIDGLDGLTSTSGLFIVDNNALTNVDGLGGITSVGSLFIRSNDALTNIDGLASVTEIGSRLDISFNAMLPDVAGLTSVGNFVIAGNLSLTNVDGLASVTHAGNIRLADNHSLGSCAVGLYDLLSGGGVDGFIIIRSNAPGCNDVCEILGTCPLGGEDGTAPLVTSLGSPYPNPVRGSTSLTYTLEVPAEIKLTVYDALGRRVRTLAVGPHPAGTHEVTWVRGDLPAGVYVVRLEVGVEAWAQRVTLLR